MVKENFIVGTECCAALVCSYSSHEKWNLSGWYWVSEIKLSFSSEL